MTSELMLRRKWTFRAYSKQVLFIKKSGETAEHVLMNAFLWALYLPEYPNLTVEVHTGDKYKPDVVALDEWADKPVFWGEAGMVSERKLHALVSRYRDTHFAMAKWDTRLDHYAKQVAQALNGVKRGAPFDLLNFPHDSVERFLDDQGNIHVSHADLERTQLGLSL